MSRPTIDELEMLNPFELGELLRGEVWKDSPDVQFIQDLIAVGCPIDIRVNRGYAALHLAARNGHLEVVKFLISKEGDVNVRDTNNQTPLHWAAAWEYSEIVKFLISKGADIHAGDDFGNTPWDYTFGKIIESCPELRS